LAARRSRTVSPRASARCPRRATTTPPASPPPVPASPSPLARGGTTAQPDAATISNGKLYLFAAGIGDQAVYTKAFDGASWSGWCAVPGVSTQVALAATDQAGVLQFFAVGTNQHHYVDVGAPNPCGW
jgi:hypothetical protein